MNKKWYKSWTFWGTVGLFIAGGCETMGVTGALATFGRICGVFGVPVTAFGIRRAFK